MYDFILRFDWGRLHDVNSPERKNAFVFGLPSNKLSSRSVFKDLAC